MEKGIDITEPRTAEEIEYKPSSSNGLKRSANDIALVPQPSDDPKDPLVSVHKIRLL